MLVETIKLAEPFLNDCSFKFREEIVLHLSDPSTIQRYQVAGKDLSILIEDNLMPDDINSKMFESNGPWVEKVIDFIFELNV